MRRSEISAPKRENRGQRSPSHFPAKVAAKRPVSWRGRSGLAGARRTEGPPSMQTGLLQISSAVGGFDAQPDFAVVAHDLASGSPSRQGRCSRPCGRNRRGRRPPRRGCRRRCRLGAARLGGRAASGHADDHDLAIALGGKGAEPWPRRLVDLAASQQVVEDRRQQIDRHDHVDVRALAVPAHLQRAASRCPAACRPRRSAPAPPHEGCAGAMKIASSSRYSQ